MFPYQVPSQPWIPHVPVVQWSCLACSAISPGLCMYQWLLLPGPPWLNPSPLPPLLAKWWVLQSYRDEPTKPLQNLPKDLIFLCSSVCSSLMWLLDTHGYMHSSPSF